MYKAFKLSVLFFILGVAAFAKVLFAEKSGFEKYRQTLLGKINRQKLIIKNHPENADAYFQLGLTLMRLGRHQEEIEAYQQAVRLKEDFADAFDNLSIANDRLHDGVNSISNSIKALQLYTKTRKHGKTRAPRRRLRFLYDKYGYKPDNFDKP